VAKSKYTCLSRIKVDGKLFDDGASITLDDDGRAARQLLALGRIAPQADKGKKPDDDKGAGAAK
jgi:hypothetical protein